MSNISRLSRLADRLEALPADRGRKFLLGAWVARQTAQCSASACAVGEATDLFKYEGFRLNKLQSPEYQGTSGWGAVCDFFRLSDGVAHGLFDADAYAPHEQEDPLAVAARIRAYCAAEMSESLESTIWQRWGWFDNDEEDPEINLMKVLKRYGSSK